jgi:hypothetical protein
MRRGGSIRLAIVPAILTASMGLSQIAHATNAVWLDVANGQGFDCDGIAGDDYFWPDNNNWSQQRVIGADPCGNPGKTLEPSNWNGPDYPDNQGGLFHWDVTLDAPANTVLDVTTTIDTLTVANDGHLDMLGGTQLNVVQSSLVNDSTIVVNSDASAGTSLLTLFSPTNTGQLSGSGVILLNQGNSGAQFQAGGSITTQAAGHTIRGKGLIVAALTNNGIVEAADTSGGGDPVLVVQTTDQTNNNIFRATSGATLRIHDMMLTQDQVTGRLIGDGPGILGRGNVELGDGAHVAGGRLEGDVDITDGTVTLENVTNLSNSINSIPGTTTVIRGPNFTNNGKFSVTSPIFNQFTFLQFATDTKLTGSGELSLGQFNAVRVSADAGVTVTNDTSHTIAGDGKWFAPLVNNGMVEGHSISFENTTIENNATMTTQSGGGFSILSTTVTQDPANGILLAGTGGTINLTNSTVTNGRLQYMPGGSFSGFVSSNAHLTNVHNQARINIPFGGSLTIEGSTFVNDGPITVNNNNVASATSIRFLDDVLVDGGGTILLNQTGNAALLDVQGGGMLTQAASHTIDGTGRIDATKFINHGTVTRVRIINSDVENDGTMTSLGEINGDVVNQGTLGGTFALSPLKINGTLTGTGPLAYIQINGTHAPGNSPAAVTVVGQYAVAASGTLAVEIGGTTAGADFDQINVVLDTLRNVDQALIDGNLSVELVDAGSGLFVPSVGDMFPILRAGTVSGTFATKDLPKAAGGRGLTWQVHYNSGDVTLELTYALTGDYNGNGVVDAADYTVWRNSLGQMGSGLAADGDGDNQIDADDYDVWKSQFGQVAPGAGAGSLAGEAVPEPSCSVLLLMSVWIGVAARPARREG